MFQVLEMDTGANVFKFANTDKFDQSRLDLSSSRSSLGDECGPTEIGDDAGNVEQTAAALQSRYALIELGIGIVGLPSKSTKR
jgi:hypothetical protein